MQTFPTSNDDVPDGACLAQAVLDARGQLLLPVGAHISHESLKALRLRGIDLVMLVDAADAAAEAVQSTPQPPRREDIDKRLRHLFRPAFEAGQLNPLFHLVAEYRTREGV